MPTLNWNMSIAGGIVGFIIGLTGMGGGALMTPVLVIFFNVSPAAAVSSDVVTSLILKPFGGGVHVRNRTVNWRLVRWLMVSSVPTAFAGAYLLDRVIGDDGGDTIKRLLGAVLVVAAVGIVARLVLQARRKTAPIVAMMDPRLVRPLPTMAIGAIGGLIVGMTSVGSGSLIIVALTLLYPKLSSKEMVGTDLVQAIPLVGAAALGHALFGHPKIDLIVSVLVGAIPAVVIGAQLSSRASDRYIRPILCATLTISALKLLEPSKDSFNGLILGLAVAFVIGFAFYYAKDRAARQATTLQLNAVERPVLDQTS